MKSHFICSFPVQLSFRLDPVGVFLWFVCVLLCIAKKLLPLTGREGKKRQFEKKMAAQKGTGAENYTCLSFKYKASFIKSKDTQDCNISCGLVWLWHANLSVFPNPCFSFFSLCGAVWALSIMASATKHRCRGVGGGRKKNAETWKFAESFA